MRDMPEIAVNNFFKELLLVFLVPDPIHAFAHHYLCSLLFLPDGEVECIIALLLPNRSQDRVLEHYLFIPGESCTFARQFWINDQNLASDLNFGLLSKCFIYWFDRILAMSSFVLSQQSNMLFGIGFIFIFELTLSTNHYFCVA